VTADVLEDADGVRTIADQQQWHTEKGQWYGITCFRNIRRNRETGPAFEEQRLFFGLENGRIRVMGVWQSVRLGNRTLYGGQVGNGAIHGISPRKLMMAA
jgi:hypothetical protein